MENKEVLKTDAYKYDFGFSFSGAQRSDVVAIRDILVENGYSVFYDFDEQANLLGKDLYRYLRDVYHNQCRYVVCFLSKTYYETKWPNLEMTAVKERLMETLFNNDFLLPIKMDEIREYEDIPSFIGFYRHSNPADTAKLLIEKFNSNLNEDHFAESAAKFLEYFRGELIKLFAKNDFIANIENETIILFKNGKETTLYLTYDKSLYTPCIKVFIDKTVDYDSALPDVLLTWDRENGLFFNIYTFNIRHSKIIDSIPMRDVVKKVFGVIKNWE